MRNLHKCKEIVFLLLNLFQDLVIATETSLKGKKQAEKNLSQILYENALQKYPMLLSNDYTTTSVPSRRFAEKPWTLHNEAHADYFEPKKMHRQLMTFAYDSAYFLKVGTSNNKVTACWHLIITYTGAIQDLRRYYEVRHLYINTMEYEIGYMAHEIISKYQRMLEIFQIVRLRYYYHRHKNKAPRKWMIYMYTLILEMSHVIIHSCNMMYELKHKYKKDGHQSFLDDYHLDLPIRFSQNASLEKHQAIKIAMDRQEQEKKEKLQSKKKWRRNNTDVRAWTDRPVRGKWPLAYGWSIEDWW